MRERKPLRELTLLDKFLFDEVMGDPENVKVILDIILGQDTEFKYPPQTEKEQRVTTKDRGIRLDVYAVDEDDVIYNVEAQRKNTKNLPKRSRLYQGIIDSRLLPAGLIDFNEMNSVVIIMITPFDLFGHGLYRYTFQMQCEEKPEVCLHDGAVRIFLNTHGEREDFVSMELIELLHYMEETTDRVAQICNSEKIQKLHQRVQRIRSSEEMEVKYMQAWEEKIMEREEGRQEGRQEGRIAREQEIVKKLRKNFSVEEIANVLEISEEEVRKMLAEEK